MENIDEIIKDWIKAQRINSLGHFKSASRYMQINRVLGLLSALAGAIVTSSLFVTISEGSEGNWLWITGIISIISTGITTAYSFLKMGELSEKHYRAAIDYSHIRKKLELLQFKGGTSLTELETINEEIYKLREHTPSIKQSIFDNAKEDVEKEEEKEKREHEGQGK